MDDEERELRKDLRALEERVRALELAAATRPLAFQALAVVLAVLAGLAGGLGLFELLRALH